VPQIGYQPIQRGSAPLCCQHFRLYLRVNIYSGFKDEIRGTSDNYKNANGYEHFNKRQATLRGVRDSPFRVLHITLQIAR